MGFIVAEYNQRMNLHKLGYTFDIRTLSSLKADCFNIVASEINKIEAEMAKKAKKRVRGRGK